MYIYKQLIGKKEKENYAPSYKESSYSGETRHISKDEGYNFGKVKFVMKPFFILYLRTTILLIYGLIASKITTRLQIKGKYM